MMAEIPRGDVFIQASARGLPVGVLKEGQRVSEKFDILRKEIEQKLLPQNNLTKG